MSRTALITGAAQGLGRAIALRLARDGLNIAVIDIETNSTKLHNTQKEIEKIGRKSVAITADVSNEKAVESMMQNAAKKLGSLDVVVANAGICQMKPFVEITAEDWDKTLSVNLRGVFLCYREAAKVMIAQGKGGKLIGCSSVAGHMPCPLSSHYCASKWGVRGLTQTAAVELAQYNITANAYCPGPMRTAMIDACGDRLGELQNKSREQVLNDMVGQVPLGRIGEPEDVAKLVSYLASENSNYITGQSIIVGGGMGFS